MSTLIDNLNSLYIEAQNSLRPSNESEIIYVYVESEDDICHWNSILNEKSINGNRKVRFEIYLPINNGYEKGKYNVLNLFKNNLGKYLILCVDSDYDYLLPNRNEDSELINNSEFIFHTYTYSIENLYSHHESLNNFCTRCIKSTSLPIDLEHLILKYSNIIYDLFCWNVFFYHRNMESSFSISDFTEVTKILINNDIENNFKTSFDCLKERVDRKSHELNTLFIELTSDKEEFKSYLLNKGINFDNCYLYANGHTILENVVLMFLKPIVKKCRGEKLREIFAANISLEQKESEKNHYLKIASKEEDLIKDIYSNFNFFNCNEFLKTKSDLNEYFNRHLN